MANKHKAIKYAVSLFLAAASLQADEWTHYAGDAAHSGVAPRAARDLIHISWFAAPADDEEYVWRSSPVVYGGRVFVNARYYVDDTHAGNLVIAYDVEDGERLWSTPIEIDQYDSWSSPVIDIEHETVILGSGYTVFAFDMSDGEIEWQRTLPRRIVCASPVISNALHVNGTPTNRVFITDYTGFESAATLYAVNVDPFDAINNPYEAGEIAWTADLPGASGNTPACDDGAVYVSSIGGVVKALEAYDGALIWETDVDLAGYPQYAGFYGGITVREGFAYAASYVYYGTGNNSGLFKFDADDGEIMWVAPCERTNSTPVVADDGRIFLAAGLDGYGSVVKVQAFQDHGDTVDEIWDTYVDTGGDLIVGGWTYQPAYSRGYLYVGTPYEEGYEFYLPCTDFYILDTTLTPSDPNFIVDHYAGTGGSPAISAGTVYSFGQDGLFAFEPSPVCLADLDGDGVVDLSDLAALLGTYGSERGDPLFSSDADINRDGFVNLADLASFLGVYGAVCE